MNFGYVKERIADETQDAVDNKLIAGWVDDLIADISKFYGPLGEVTITADANTFYDLPNDFIEKSEIWDSNGKYYLYYTITSDGKISFDDSGVFKVTYHTVPDVLPRGSSGEVEDETEIPIHRIFHKDIVTGCLAHYWSRENEARAMDIFDVFHSSIRRSAQLLKQREHRVKFTRWSRKKGGF